MNRLPRATIVAALLVVSLSCAAGRPSPPAVQFVQPPSDRAYIYVFRNAGIYRGHIKLWLDGVFAGSTSRRSFAFFQVRPGRHVLSSGSKDASEIALNVLGGEVIYLEQDVTVVPVGLSPFAGLLVGDDRISIEFHRVSRADGRAGVRECRLIPDLPHPLPPVAEPDEPPEIPLTAGPRPHSRP
jgi:hypothetical protein